MKSISGTITEVFDITSGILTAVEQQNAATDEISQSITLASGESSQAAGNVTQVTEAIGKTSIQADQVNTVSGLLADVSVQLSDTVEEFLNAVAADVEERRRNLRQACSDKALLIIGNNEMEVQVTNSSEGGYKLEGVEGLEVGQAATLQSPVHDRLSVEVIWCDSGAAGVKLREVAKAAA